MGGIFKFLFWMMPLYGASKAGMEGNLGFLYISFIFSYYVYVIYLPVFAYDKKS
jgi:hypothetical protein